MTAGGGSLGLRTGSYGSLQQHHQNNHHHFNNNHHHHFNNNGNNAGGSIIISATSSSSSVTPSTSSPSLSTPPAGGSAGRKPQKMIPSGTRDKEPSFLPWICRVVVGRKKIGMLVIMLISFAVFISIAFVVNKDDDVPRGPEMQNMSSLMVENLDSSDPTVLNKPPLILSDGNGAQIENLESLIGTNKSIAPPPPPPPMPPPPPPTPPPPPWPPLYNFPSRHPCQNFTLSPPPPGNRRPGPRPCSVCYVPVEHAIAVMPTEPSVSHVLKNLSYIYGDSSDGTESEGGSTFGGHPSLRQRNESFDIKESMTVHCGFVKGNRPGHETGFDIDDDALLEMEQCRGVVVASAIFGNYDVLQQPKNISEAAKRTICFYMFVDEETGDYIRNSTTIDNTNTAGLWRIVVVRNLPYADARRNGKVPKLLLHRLFPSARYSLWIDGKLQLVADPYLLLERFLWRENATFAISNHYRRFDVFEEAEANKAAGKYENASIDYQIDFYRREGLTHYSSVKLPIVSDVPEGCVIIREHIPITNLFTCLWFNEVDRFTSRDQLSFSSVRDKIISKVNWGINMFLDCERRNFVIQIYHRDLLEQMASSLHPPPPPPPVRPSTQTASDSSARALPKKQIPRRGKEKRPNSRRHHPKGSISRGSLGPRLTSSY
ncbi:hypothetical protein QJS10_CPB20g01778 [Acorus calamus]|uniref:TOD1/MUCI70 glycosyltransferase-like domain-containing protein n=1 Tax=Acorus calamus TaxID=4465 RepID=A0AAV9CDK8_ACOCL|nr:hypothetical protein QJS10_CPB20g01778 [Acorus calamus]